VDDTVKYLYELCDGECIESVVMKYHHGYTVCISSQVGCRMGCSFCASGIDGLIRNLSASEMLAQVEMAGKDNGVRISNVRHQVGNWGGQGTAFLMAWGSYYHDEGTVWITTGTSSTAPFNALKKNGVMVYPISAKQYISGAWVEETVKSYQGGEWVDWWNGPLYEPGNTYDGITGGWENWFSSGGSFVVGASSLNFNYSESGGGSGTPLATKKKIELTGFSELSVKVTNFTKSNNGMFWFGVTDTTYSDNSALSNGFIAHTVVTADGKWSVDVSELSGEYYIVLFVKATYTSGETHKASGSVTEVKLS
jgi:hypothetical protein